MSLWAKYVKERDGRETIENENGFIVFLFKGEECYLEDIYVLPEKRLSGIGSSLFAMAEERARQQGCKFLSSQIIPSEAQATGSMAAHLAKGFRIYAAQNNRIIMFKELS